MIDKNILIFKQILPTGTIGNVEKTVRRTCMLIVKVSIYAKYIHIVPVNHFSFALSSHQC